MTNSKSKLRQRTDWRLDRTRDPAILNAAVAALTENGYTATNMNDIAARAGVGKAAIYRRWSSKAALITDALLYWRPDLLRDEAPDTGSLTRRFRPHHRTLGPQRRRLDLHRTGVAHCP
jgi:AcrR family transcriptional regulator